MHAKTWPMPRRLDLCSELITLFARLLARTLAGFSSWVQHQEISRYRSNRAVRIMILTQIVGKTMDSSRAHRSPGRLALLS